MKNTSKPMHQQKLQHVNRSALASCETPGLRSSRLVYFALLGFFACAFQAQAAGGHHSVDDAVLLEPGQCELESWGERENGGGRKLFHLGSSCRVGRIELGVNAERNREAGNDAMKEAGLQAKWAYSFTESWSAGVLVTADWHDGSPSFAGSTVVLPFTWKASESLQLHANIGRDLKTGGRRIQRHGAAVEWAPLPAWSLVAERFRESETNFWRAGARYAINPNLSIDLSQARGLGNSAPPWLTFGVNWMFER